jgi:uncharacterized protein
MFVEITEGDRSFYAAHLAGFLPTRIVDVHTHVWLRSFVREAAHDPRLAQWPERVAADNSIADLLTTYALLLPAHKVTPLLFGWPERSVDLAQTNAYTVQVARDHRLPGLLVSTPEWSAAELEQAMQGSGLLGLKPYLSFAPLEMPANRVTIYDFLPPAHLEVADAHGWLIMLHIPRPARLRDAINLQQLLDIERHYPRLRLIIAHVGRAYCNEDVGEALDVLAGTERMVFDFSANTNGEVISRLLQAVGPKRVLFGSDLPVVRMRMRRTCENGVYINHVPAGLYGDVSDDPHMREVTGPAAEEISFFLYEQLLAFRQAAELANLDATGVEDVFYNNAVRLGVI